MNKFARSTRSAIGAFANKARGVKQAAGALALSAMTSVALATPTGLGETAATEITASKSQVDSVQSALIGLLILLVIFSFIRRSMGK